MSDRTSSELTLCRLVLVVTSVGGLLLAGFKAGRSRGRAETSSFNISRIKSTWSSIGFEDSWTQVSVTRASRLLLCLKGTFSALTVEATAALSRLASRRGGVGDFLFLGPLLLTGSVSCFPTETVL